MPVCVNRITVENKTFSLNALIANPDAYLPLMKLHMPESTFIRKDTEEFESYLKRIFNYLHKRVEFATTIVTVNGVTRRQTSSVTLPVDCNDILNALGIEVVKKCPKRSSVMFKYSGNKYRMNNEGVNDLVTAIKNGSKLTSNNHPKISIGVEMEFIGSKGCVSSFTREMKSLVGEERFDPAMCYNKNKGNKWVLGTDGSVHPSTRDGAGKRGYELTSPILDLSSEKDMAELKAVTLLVKEVFNGTTNTSCGTHVHMSFPVKSASDDLIMHFARSYKKSEESLFDRVVPKSRRESKARYSKSVNLNYVFDRYRKLNFCNVKKDSNSMHLEFRQLDGTLDFDKIYTWCKLQRLFIELTLDSWKKKTDNEKKAIKIELNDVLITNADDNCAVENLMRMGGLVA